MSRSWIRCAFVLSLVFLAVPAMATDHLIGALHGQNGPLVDIPTATGISSQIGLLGLTGVTTIAREGNLLYIATGDGNDALYTYDLNTASLSFVGYFTGGASNIQSMEIAPVVAGAHGFVPGQMYGISIDGIGGCNPMCFFRIDKTTAEATPIAGLQLNNGAGMSFNPVTGELWVYDQNGKDFYTLGPTGQLTFRFKVPSSHLDSRTGIDTMWSLAHDCAGNMFGVDVAYGVLLYIDEVAHQAYWVSPAQGSVAVNYDRDLRALEGPGECNGQVPVRPDVWLRDNYDDVGEVPTDGYWWGSPDVWNRRAADCAPSAGQAVCSEVDYQNPFFLGETNYLYAKIRNRGNAKADQVVVRFYTADFALGFRFPDQFTLAGTVTLYDLLPGEVRDIGPVSWPGLFAGPVVHKCIMVRAEEVWYNGVLVDPIIAPPLAPPPPPPESAVVDQTNRVVRYNNNVALRNIFNADPLGQSADFLFSNPDSIPHNATLTLETPQDILNQGMVTLTIDPALYTAWVNAGGTLEGVIDLGGGLFQLVQPLAFIRGIPLAPLQATVVSFAYTGSTAVARITVSMTMGGQVIGGIILWVRPDPVEPPCANRPLGTANGFNTFVLGNATQSSTDVGGAMAVGGTANLSCFGVAYEYPGFAGDSLVVGGNLYYSDGQVFNGDIAYGGGISLTHVTVANGTVHQATPIDFAAEGTYLRGVSDFWATLAVNGVTAVQYYGSSAHITFTGTDPDLNVFSVSGSDLWNATYGNVNLTAPAGSTAVVNVTGTTNRMQNFFWNVTGVSPNNVLVNFYQTTYLNLSAMGSTGLTVLAPRAVVYFNNMELNGTLIAAHLYGNGQTNWRGEFGGCLPLP